MAYSVASMAYFVAAGIAARRTEALASQSLLPQAELTFRAEIMRSSDPVNIQLTGTDPAELLGLSEKIKEGIVG